jgi:hypothetical protein
MIRAMTNAAAPIDSIVALLLDYLTNEESRVIGDALMKQDLLMDHKMHRA